MTSTCRSSQLDESSMRPSLQKQSGRRLSKPRTRTLGASLSTGNLLDSGSPISPKPSPSSSRTDTTLEYLSDVCTGRNDSDQDLHEFALAQDSDVSNIKDDDGEGLLVRRIPTVKQRISRTGTMLGKKATSRLSLGGSKSQSRLSLPAAEDNPEERDRMINEIKQKAHNDSMIALNHVTSPVDNEEGRPAIAPIRRRSLFTPGLATRNPKDLLKKPPNYEHQSVANPTETERQRYYNPMLSDASPLGRIAALDLASGGRSSPISRASTPGDFDYGHLGSRCALRITNGAASPIPSLRSIVPGSRKASGNTQYSESFYTASEGGFGYDDLPPPPIQQVYRKSFEYVDRSMTPRLERFGQSEYGRVCTPLHGPRPSIQPRSPLRWQSMADLSSPVQQKAFEKVSDGYFDIPPTNSRLDRTSMIAQEYIADISGTPYASTSNLHRAPSFEPTSKANEFEAELFDDAASDSRAQRWSTSYQDRNNDVVIESTTISHSTSVTTMSSTVSSTFDARPRPEPLVNNADSGYSSSTSRGSSKKQRVSSRGQPLIDKSSSRPPQSDYFGEVLIQPSESHRESMQVSGRPFIPTPESETVAQVLARPRSIAIEPCTDRGRPGRTAYRQISSGSRIPLSKYAATPEIVSVPYESTQVSGVNPAKHFAADAPRSSSVGPKKLQKKPRPKSVPPPMDRITVQGNRDVSGSHIPPIPADMAARHASRLQEFPPLDRTVADLRGRRPANEDRGTVTIAPPMCFPSPAHSPEPPKKRVFSGRKISFNKSPDPAFSPVEPQSLPEPTKGERRWSRQHVPDHFEAPNISDFGDVTGALGQSPYDIAYSTRDSSPPKRSSTAHPHQFTTAMPRAKSMVGMNDAEASSLSQRRHYYGNHRPTPQHQTTPTPPIPSQPHSAKPSQSRHFDDRGGIPGKMPRPKSMQAADIPPLPAIPVKTQIDDMEKQAKRANRRTMLDPSTKPWESFTVAWAQRRKSAGEGLLSRPEQGPRAASDRPHMTTHHEASESPVRRSSTRPHPSQAENLSVPKHSSRQHLAVPEPRPKPRPHSSQNPSPSLSASSSVYSLRSDSNVSTQSKQSKLGVQEGTVARLSGRFENGFAYAYEHGSGIGGSAGTRSAHTVASRKSVEWGKSYGIDLSDVPIFVTPNLG
ncbi:MAG: hypothetical protein MMC23_008232 [Stictis urceolatum]|nr:hypothetical protein [Stictis urceolata]